MRRSFSHADHETASATLREWHAGLKQDRGSRARLGRAAGPDEVLFVPSFHQLLAKLRPTFRVENPAIRRNLAAFAGLAARVQEHAENLPLARQMSVPGGRKSSSGPAVSEQRFRRLLTTPSLDARYAQLSRVIHLLGNRVDLLSLADAVCYWDTEPELRQQWAYDYYQTALS